MKRIFEAQLSNVPPTPANYAQRSGRAGRSGQPALVLTYRAAQSPHDQWFFHHTPDMVHGIVKPLTLDLANRDLLEATRTQMDTADQVVKSHAVGNKERDNARRRYSDAARQYAAFLKTGLPQTLRKRLANEGYDRPPINFHTPRGDPPAHGPRRPWRWPCPAALLDAVPLRGWRRTPRGASCAWRLTSSPGSGRCAMRWPTRRAEALLADHRRVSEAAHDVGQYSVRPSLPVDVLDVYVLLPGEL